MNSTVNQTVIENIIKEVVAEYAKKNLIPTGKLNTIPMELSARHVHLSQKDIDALFNGTLTYKQELSQPGQFLCNERVRVIGPKGIIENVAVLGPPREQSQVEISITDARQIGTNAPVRQSGDLVNTPGVILASENGIVGLEEGLIIAGRHIHMTPEDAKRFNVKDKEKVCVHMNSIRPAVFEDVLIRTNDNFKLAMHIDFDEANGCGWNADATCKIIKDDKEAACGLYSA